MANRIGFEFQVGARAVDAPRRVDPDDPLRILILGDFSGRANRAVEQASNLASRRLPRVDVDNFDQVLAACAPSLRLVPGADTAGDIEVVFHELDDFHPDRLYGNVDMFRALREARTGLQDPATFARTADGLRQSIAHQAVGAGAAPAAPAENDATTFARLLGSAGAAPATSLAPQPQGVQALIRSIVAPHIVPDAPPQQAQYLATVDGLIRAQMQFVLHDPAFQALEAAWRSVRWLLAETEAGETLHVHLLDVSLAELRADMRACDGDHRRSGLYRRLVEHETRAADGLPWSLLAGAFTLGKNVEDIELMAFLGAVAAHAGGPLIAGADASFAGCASLAATPDPRDWQAGGSEAEARWLALRKSPVAAWLGLALPQVLMRLPYGRKTDAVAAFPFEELDPDAAHGEFLWGSAAVACALLTSRAFAAAGWSMQPGDERDLGDLPAYIRERDGEKLLMPAAEAYLGERAVDVLVGAGLMPLASMKNRNAILVPRMQSIAAPARPLAGPWDAA